jgi:hypothetical protein
MEEFNIQGKQTPFYKYCPGTFGYTLVYAYVNVSARSNECDILEAYSRYTFHD